MRIGICDDNRIDLKAMQEVISCVAPEHVVDSFSEGKELLGTILKGTVYDLLFLDIIMPELNGMDLAREAGRITPETQVVFLTDSDAYAVEAFSVKALHYIIKPMTKSALKECLHRLEEKQNQRRRIHIISSAGIQQIVFADEIQYAQSDAHYFNLHLADGTDIKVRMTQSELQDILGDLFLPVSRGLIVNVDFIRQLDTKSCTLKDGRKILLSRKNQDKIHSAYAAYVFSQLKR